MAIDLSTVVYRAYQRGDLEPESLPSVNNITPNPTARPINLGGIKFRTKMVGDVEE